MKRLILMRHAKTEAWNEGIDDHGRALTERGHQDADLMAEALVSRGWVPGLALVSTARRAKETWAHLTPAFEASEHRFMEDLYLSGMRGLLDTITQHDGVSTLMLVAHNPGMHDCAVEIMRQGGGRDHHAALTLSAKMPTGAAALFEAEEDAAFLSQNFRLVDFIKPKDLRD